MTPDRSLPATQEELRDIVLQAWRQGWNDRRALMGKPAGTVEAEKWRRLDAFVASLDLPARVIPPPASIKEAIHAILTKEIEDVTK